MVEIMIWIRRKQNQTTYWVHYTYLYYV